jgi:hypothetical protein
MVRSRSKSDFPFKTLWFFFKENVVTVGTRMRDSAIDLELYNN